VNIFDNVHFSLVSDHGAWHKALVTVPVTSPGKIAMIRTVLATALSAVVLTTAFAPPAFARPRPFTAQLTQPVTEQTQIVTNNAVWTCIGDTCTARVDEAATVQACRAISSRLGEVRSYGSATAPLSDERLAACNQAAAPAQTLNASN